MIEYNRGGYSIYRHSFITSFTETTFYYEAEVQEKLLERSPGPSFSDLETRIIFVIFGVSIYAL